jgi:hypothetical protein
MIVFLRLVTMVGYALMMVLCLIVSTAAVLQRDLKVCFVSKTWMIVRQILA